LTSVIVVDDDREMVTVISQRLEKNGIQVIGKGFNGKDAVILYQKLKPDIVLLDLKMPGFNGQYAIDKIKTMNSDAKILVITGHTEEKLDKSKISMILYKPYNIEELLRKIKELK